MAVARRRKGKEAEARVLAAIRDLWGETGYGPSYRELSARTGLVQSSVHSYVQALCEAGLVHEAPRIARSVRVTPAGHDALAGLADQLEGAVTAT